MLNFCFLTPKRHIFARNRVVWRRLLRVKIGSGAWAVGCWKNPEKRSRVNIFDAQFRAYGEKKETPWRIVTKFCVLVDPGHNHVCNFWWWSVKGFGRGRGRISRFPIDLRRRPYNTLALPCKCVIRNHNQSVEWYEFRWPWVTPDPQFKEAVILKSNI